MSLPVLGVHMSNTNPRAPQAIVVPLSNAAFRFWFILAISLNTLQIIPDVHKALGKTLLRENSSGDLSTLKSSLSLFGGYRRCYVRNSEGHVNVPCTRSVRQSTRDGCDRPPLHHRGSTTGKKKSIIQMACRNLNQADFWINRHTCNPV